MRFARRFFAVALGACASIGLFGAAAAQTPSAQAAQAASAQGIAQAQAGTADAATAEPPIQDYAPVMVTGIQPGPGMWRVSKDDHVMWVLGTLTPLPKDVQWDANEVEKLISRSQEIIGLPFLTVDAKAGWFTKLTLIPSALKARRNPDGRTLREILPPAQYARWQALKTRYIGRDQGIESWRPVFAAMELYDQAIAKSGMTERSITAKAIAEASKQYGVPITRPQVRIAVENPRQVLRDFSSTALNDTECFVNTLDRIERDLGLMAERGNAWAIGDLQRLRELPYRNQYVACMAAFTQTALAERAGVRDAGAQVERAWMQAAESALQRNASTFALLPISELFKPNGYLAKLQAKGYEVIEP